MTVVMFRVSKCATNPVDMIWPSRDHVGSRDDVDQCIVHSIIVSIMLVREIILSFVLLSSIVYSIMVSCIVYESNIGVLFTVYALSAHT